MKNLSVVIKHTKSLANVIPMYCNYYVSGKEWKHIAGTESVHIVTDLYQYSISPEVTFPINT